MTPRLNCYIAAYRHYASGQATWMACRMSHFAQPMRFPALVRALGTAIVWPASVLWLLGHYLRFANWPHWIWCQTMDPECEEYVPQGDKIMRRFPPIFFNGIERRHVERRKR